MNTSNISITVSSLPPQKFDSSEVLKWTIICVVATLFGLACATIKFMSDIYKSPKKKLQRQKKAEKERRDREKRAILAVKPGWISTEDFKKRFKQKKSAKTLVNEVRAIVFNQPTISKETALKAENVKKNFSLDVVAGDDARIILTESYDRNDYINASFIPGYLGEPRHYIATQSPRNPEECQDFWQMVWQEGVMCIVMAMGLYQQTSIRCYKYWEHPLKKKERAVFGRYSVIVVNCDSNSVMLKRKIHVFKDNDEENYREITQLEFFILSEDDASIDPSMYLHIRHHAALEHQSGPLLIHCSCGGTKTAILIVLDYCMHHIDHYNCVDVYSTVLMTRYYRTNMIRTLSQYRTIHDVLSLYIVSGGTIISHSDLPSKSEKMAVPDTHTYRTKYQHEFKIIQELQVYKPTGTVGHHLENRPKSRSIMLQPDDRYRPYLNSADNGDDTEYINAVYIDGYYCKNAYIVTEWPQTHTTNNFWRLVYDHKVASVVFLQIQKFSKTWPQFWPTICNGELAVSYGPFVLRYHECQENSLYNIYNLSIYRKPKIKSSELSSMMESITKWTNPTGSGWKEDEHMVKIFQLKEWRNRDATPQSAKSLMYFYDSIEKWQSTLAGKHQPICVISRDGYRRCGVFITIHIGSLALKEHGEVDIFNIVRMIKHRRPQLVFTETEYSYCFHFLAVLVDMVMQISPESLPSLKQPTHSTEIPLTCANVSGTDKHRDRQINVGSDKRIKSPKPSIIPQHPMGHKRTVSYKYPTHRKISPTDRCKELIRKVNKNSGVDSNKNIRKVLRNSGNLGLHVMSNIADVDADESTRFQLNSVESESDNESYQSLGDLDNELLDRLVKQKLHQQDKNMTSRLSLSGTNPISLSEPQSTDMGLPFNPFRSSDSTRGTAPRLSQFVYAHTKREKST